MPAEGSALTDILAFLEAQHHERYRAFIVHSAPMKGKTVFARKLAERVNATYIDVLEVVTGNRELAEQVDLLDANFLKQLALDAASAGAGVILLDEFDFLVPVWGGDLTALFEIVRKLSVAETQAVFGFVMQTTPALETFTLTNSAGQSRILPLDEIQGLK